MTPTRNHAASDAPARPNGPFAVRLIDLVSGLSRAMDMISPAVVNHHVRVGYIAVRLAEILGLPDHDRRDLLLAGLLHDAGALSLKTRLDALAFETDNEDHAEAGYKLIRDCPGLRASAELIRNHHTPWSRVKKSDPPIPPLSNLLCLADRIDSLINRDHPLSGQVAGIRGKIQKRAGTLFNPDHVQAFLALSEEPDFWRGAEEPGKRIPGLTPPDEAADILDLDGALVFSRLFSQIIDFRSRFTATHSRGVAEIALFLAELSGFTPDEGKMLYIAGLLHDIGKLAVPVEFLEKPRKLSQEEFSTVKLHALHSSNILGGIPGLETVDEWASLHHERIDGRGYPFQRAGEDLPLGSRIVAVADVFTAIAEDRPYRLGMDQQAALDVLKGMAAANELDAEIVALLEGAFDRANARRIHAQDQAREDFLAFYVA